MIVISNILCTVLAFLSVGCARGNTAYLHLNRDSQVSKLFTRQGPASKYPPLDIPGPTPKPEWIEALNREKQAGNIPTFKPSIKTAEQSIIYENGINGSDPKICSWTIGCTSPTEYAVTPSLMADFYRRFCLSKLILFCFYGQYQ